MIQSVLAWLTVVFRPLSPVSGTHTAPRRVVPAMAFPSVRTRDVRVSTGSPTVTAEQDAELNDNPPALVRPYLLVMEKQRAMERVDADLLYDALSDALRGRATVDPEPWHAFVRLDDHLRHGGVLPSPWESAK